NGGMIGNARSCADPVRAKTNGTTAEMGQGRKLLTFHKLLCIAKLPWRSVVVSAGPYPAELIAMNFEVQSYLSHHGVEADPPVTPTRPPGPLRVRTATEWVAYLRSNAARCRPTPWERGAEVPPAQLACIARPLQAWQLGETPDGCPLRAAARRYAERVGDP